MFIGNQNINIEGVTTYYDFQLDYQYGTLHVQVA